jgi:acyl-CoA thioesterase-1
MLGFGYALARMADYCAAGLRTCPRLRKPRICAETFRLGALLVRGLVLAIILGFPCFASAANTLVVFGDSISAGYGLPQGAGWVSLLSARMAKAAPDYKVVNASISGETLAGGRRRIESVLEQHKPAVVIVELGGNDGLRGAPIEAIQSDLAAIVDACLRRKARVMVLGMRLPPNYGAAYVQRFQQVYAAVAQERPVTFVPFLFEGFAERHELFQPDGIHPTRAAQPLMLESVWKPLAPLLTPARRAQAPQ